MPNCIYIFIVAFIFQLTPSFAQRSRQSFWEEGNSYPKDFYSGCPSYLECAQRFAIEEQQRITSAVEKMRRTGDGFVPCDEDKLIFEQDYVDWYFKNKDEFENLYHELLTAIETQNEKLSEIKEQTVEVIPTAEQKETITVPVSLRMIQDYLIQLNQRLRSCPEDQLKVLMDGVENPRWNDPKIAHSQVQTAIDRINLIALASLQQKNVATKIVLKSDMNQRKKGKAFSLTLETVYHGFSLGNMDLLEKEQPPLTEAKKWDLMIRSGATIGGYPIDGNLRYAAMNVKRQTTCAKSDFVPAFSGVPFVSYDYAVSKKNVGFYFDSVSVSLASPPNSLVLSGIGFPIKIGGNPRAGNSSTLVFKDKLIIFAINNQTSRLEMLEVTPNNYSEALSGAWKDLGGNCKSLTSAESSDEGGDGYMVHVIGSDGGRWRYKTATRYWSLERK